ncbi:hypothetical protein [Magnetospirillum sp. SS-4]|uniref:hypothetical protein n=1 Tax=Magnetospirillum sp. SS-4 TaxID=2681465 RepID=UPI0015726EF0|nr:hypothetical protein [Magnetospirillum sp. SS-4]
MIVSPNLRELREGYGDIRHAFNAIAAVDALAGHIWRWCRDHAPQEIVGAKNDIGFKQRLAEANADFALVRDMAKAQKHVHLDHGAPALKGADQIEARRMGWGQARWGEGRWGSPQQVVVETDLGEVRVVEAVLGRALMFLECEMERVGITPSTSTG